MPGRRGVRGKRRAPRAPGRTPIAMHAARMEGRRSPAINACDSCDQPCCQSARLRLTLGARSACRRPKFKRPYPPSLLACRQMKRREYRAAVSPFPLPHVFEQNWLIPETFCSFEISGKENQRCADRQPARTSFLRSRASMERRFGESTKISQLIIPVGRSSIMLSIAPEVRR